MDTPKNIYPFFSIITVCYNSERTIADTIDSILNQTFNDIEYIIIDALSTDKTIEIIQSYVYKFQQKGIAYKWISEKDKGIYDAMNKGINMAKGNLIGIINSDDWYSPNALKIVAEVYNNNPQYHIFHGLMKVWENDKLSYIRGTSDNFFPWNVPPHPTCFILKSVYESVGHYDTRYKIAADNDMLIRLKLAGFSFYLIEEVIANFRTGGASSKLQFPIDLLTIRRKYRYISFLKYVILMLIFNILNYIFSIYQQIKFKRENRY